MTTAEVLWGKGIPKRTVRRRRFSVPLVVVVGAVVVVAWVTP